MLNMKEEYQNIFDILKLQNNNIINMLKKPIENLGEKLSIVKNLEEIDKIINNYMEKLKNISEKTVDIKEIKENKYNENNKCNTEPEKK